MVNTLVKSLKILEEESGSWDKLTINYAIKNKSKIEEHIHKVRHCYDYEVDDIYEELIEYLHKGKDYDISYINSEDGTSMTLENYVNMCANYCIKRYFTRKYNENSKFVNIYSIGDMENNNCIENIMDLHTDEEYEKASLDIYSSLKSLEYKRYKYGCDIYLLMFIRYLTLGDNSLYDIVHNILIGDICNCNSAIEKDTDFKTAIKLLANSTTDEAIKYLSSFVYGYKDILNIIHSQIHKEYNE